MLEFIFDTARTVSDLVLSEVLTRHPGIRWVFTHAGGALPVLADRIELFRSILLGGDGPSAPDQVAGLWFDLPAPRTFVESDHVPAKPVISASIVSAQCAAPRGSRL